jgi:hypothetical protein
MVSTHEMLANFYQTTWHNIPETLIFKAITDLWVPVLNTLHISQILS